MSGGSEWQACGPHRGPITPVPPPNLKGDDSEAGEEREKVRGNGALTQHRLGGKTCIVGHCSSRKGRLFADILGEGRVYGDSIEALEHAVLHGPIYTLVRIGAQANYAIHVKSNNREM
jgi:hypothetical protein